MDKIQRQYFCNHLWKIDSENKARYKVLKTYSSMDGLGRQILLFFPASLETSETKSLYYLNQVVKVIASATFQSPFELNGQDIRERNYHYHCFSIFT